MNAKAKPQIHITDLFPENEYSAEDFCYSEQDNQIKIRSLFLYSKNVFQKVIKFIVQKFEIHLHSSELVES